MVENAGFVPLHLDWAIDIPLHLLLQVSKASRAVHLLGDSVVPHELHQAKTLLKSGC